MVQYTTPVTSAFEVQRAAIEQSQKAVEQGLAFQQNVTRAYVDSLDSQEAAQRRGVELGRTLVDNYLDAVEATVPGVEPTVAEIRRAVDEQYDFVLDNHAEAFEALASEVEEGADAYDELTEDFVAAAEEQLALFVEAHEELESQSVEAVEEWAANVENLQEQVEEVQEQVREVQEQAAEAVEA